jgi:hypothetical protein
MIRTNKLNKWKRTHVRLLVDKKGNFTEITEDAAESLNEYLRSGYTISKGKDGYIVYRKGAERIGEAETIASAMYFPETDGLPGLCEDALDELERTADWFVTYTLIYA